MPYLMEALGPGHGHAVAGRRRDEARGCLPARGAVALAVVVHLAAEAGASAGVLAGEEVHLRGGAGRHHRASGGGEGVPAARREDEREEDDHGHEEHRPDGVEEGPLPLRLRAAAAPAAVRPQGAEEAHRAVAGGGGRGGAAVVCWFDRSMGSGHGGRGLDSQLYFVGLCFAYRRARLGAFAGQRDESA